MNLFISQKHMYIEICYDHHTRLGEISGARILHQNELDQAWIDVLIGTHMHGLKLKHTHPIGVSINYSTFERQGSTVPPHHRHLPSFK
jgi:hypothetical protein